MGRVEGAWAHTGQDCDTDNYFEPPADMQGMTFTLARDHTYSLTRNGQKLQGTFTLQPYDGDDPDGVLWIVVLEQARLTFILNVDRLESWTGEAVPVQCTQLFERIDYRPVHEFTLTDDVEYIKPKKRVY